MAKKSVDNSYYYSNETWKEERIINIPLLPTKDNIKKLNDKWDKGEDGLKEKALEKLFGTLCRNNKDMNDIIIKICALNTIYSTNIYEICKMGEVIKESGVDQGLKDIDLGLVDRISKKAKEKIGSSAYSFASKYCSHHAPEEYPIYDSYVDIILKYYRDHRKEEQKKPFIFENKALNTYPSFCGVINDFMDSYDLHDFHYKQIDIFLWQEGKRCFSHYIEVNDEEK